LADFLGGALTVEILEGIRSRSGNSNEVILLSSIDENSFPNIALLSYFDLCAVTPKRMLFAIGKTSSTKKNLVRTSKTCITLWLGKEMGIVYVKGSAKILKEKMRSKSEGRMSTAFELSVERVSRDYIPGEELLSTITYDAGTNEKEREELFKELEKLSKNS
jgi:hypothetical protein